MTMPPCFPLINLQFFSNLESEINGAVSAEELQSLINRVFGEISVLESTLTSQLAFLGPIEALLTSPASNPGAIVTWITTLITDFLTPILKPVIVMTAQLAELPIQIAALTAAIESVAASKFPAISITIPPISIGCSL
jgi:hypothetical protein